MKEKVELAELGRNLPPMISRDHVEKLLGGVISSKTFLLMN